MMRTLFRWVMPLAGILSLAWGIYLISINQPIDRQETPPRAPTTAPVVGKLAYIGASGTSEPQGKAVTITSSNTGIVTSVAVTAGQQVRVGDELFRLDDRRSARQIALRRSQVEVEKANVEKPLGMVSCRQAAVRSWIAQVRSAVTKVDSAIAVVKERKNQLRIAEAVQDPRAVSKEIVDRRRFAVEQAETAVETSRAGVSEAKANLEERKAELRMLVDPETGQDGPDVVAAKRRISQAEQELKQAELERELLTVRSPIHGTILQVNVHVGELAIADGSDEGLILMGRSGPLHLRVEIDEIDIPRFSSQSPAWASPRGNASLRVPLEFVYLEPLVVPKTNLSGRKNELIDTRVMQVVYQLPNSTPPVGIGQQFDVYIEVEQE